MEGVRKTHRARKLNRIYRNLNYINKKRVNKTFQQGDLILIQDVALAANNAGRCTYRPAIVLDITQSGNCALVQTLGTNRVLKYHFTYMKKLTRPLFAQLPENWQGQIISSLDRRVEDLSSQEMEDEEQEESQEVNT